MRDIVISIGGSIMLPENREEMYLGELIGLLRKYINEFRFYCVTGGGKTARHYIELGRALGANESSLDEVGIEITRINARILISAIGTDVNNVPARNYDEAVAAGKHHSFIVMGGVASGYTTDAVSAILAERVNAEVLIIMTSVDAVYSDDPKKIPNAKRYENLTPQELIEISSKNQMKAGSTNVIDPVASLIIARSNLKAKVIHGQDLKSLENILLGKKFQGTTIES